VGVPEERQAFESKLELGLKMVRRAQAEQLSFEAVLGDEL
jgi:SRSO17 transposase